MSVLRAMKIVASALIPILKHHRAQSRRPTSNAPHCGLPTAFATTATTIVSVVGTGEIVAAKILTTFIARHARASTLRYDRFSKSGLRVTNNAAHAIFL